jgi:hypothetical protein
MSTASETTIASTLPNFEVGNFGTRSLYDLMETNEKIVLLVVKEQLSHYKIKKVNDDGCKSLLAWRKFMNQNFLMLFSWPNKF